MKEYNSNSSQDIFGIKPFGEASNAIVNKSLEGIETFLKLVCVPAFEEFGKLLGDNVRSFRLNNIIRILSKAEGKFEFNQEKLQFKVHPRIALSIIENGSLIDNDELQEMWAGLFVSSCAIIEQSDENLIFVDLLKQLTSCEAKIIKYACENAKKILYENGLIIGDDLNIECKDLINISGVKEIHILDRDLDHLRSLELIGFGFGGGGFNASDNNLTADITPTPLALYMYVKTQGYNFDPKFFWKSNIVSIQEHTAFKEAKQKEEALKQRLEKEKSNSVRNQ
jgi:hypothetical protein